LDQHWEVLAEAAQSLLRAHGHTDAYEALKESMQGRRLTESGWLAWVEEADLPEALKKTLGAMRPDQYIGLADQLVGFLPKDLTI
jgi:adenylosuccinate lyase